MILSHSEIWKPIPGYEGLYDASSLGRIRSTPGKTTSNSRYEKRIWKSRILKPKWCANDKSPRRRVCLWKDGKPKDYYVSRLVCMAFHGMPNPENLTVNHIDGNWENDDPNNLEWVSRKENIRLGFEMDLYNSVKKPIALKSEYGDVFKFSSMADASRFLGKGTGYISNAIRKNNGIYSSFDGIKYSVVC